MKINFCAFDLQIGVIRISGSDGGNQTIEIKSIKLDLGLDPTILKPSDQKLPRNLAASRIGDQQANDEDEKNSAHNSQKAGSLMGSAREARASALAAGR